jgi:large subunit ribosomal protein L25
VSVLERILVEDRIMADRVSLIAEPRDVVGKKVKRLRRDGWIPAVIYGQGEPITIQLENGPLRRILRAAGTSDLLVVEIGDDHRTVLVRDIQQHVTRGDLIHLDFLEVNMQQSVTTTADLVTINKSKPEQDGTGVPILELRSVDIEALPDDLVSEIEVDLSLLQGLHDQITVEQLSLPKGVTILNDPATLVARIQLPRIAEEEEEEVEEELYMPAADAVEVIGKGKDEDDF